MKNMYDEILEATQRVIDERGIAYLTIGNVAKEAGVSKGGLLHHFPNKNALIQGKINAVLDSYVEEMEAIYSKDTSNFLNAYAEVSLNNPEQLTSGLLAAKATDPELLKPVQNQYQEWQKKIEEDELDPVLATIIRLAIDGLWYNEIFGLEPTTEGLRKDVLERLRNLTREK